MITDTFRFSFSAILSCLFLLVTGVFPAEATRPSDDSVVRSAETAKAEYDNVTARYLLKENDRYRFRSLPERVEKIDEELEGLAEERKLAALALKNSAVLLAGIINRLNSSSPITDEDVETEGDLMPAWSDEVVLLYNATLLYRNILVRLLWHTNIYHELLAEISRTGLEPTPPEDEGPKVSFGE